MTYNTTHNIRNFPLEKLEPLKRRLYNQAPVHGFKLVEAMIGSGVPVPFAGIDLMYADLFDRKPGDLIGAKVKAADSVQLDSFSIELWKNEVEQIQQEIFNILFRYQDILRSDSLSDHFNSQDETEFLKRLKIMYYLNDEIQSVLKLGTVGYDNRIVDFETTCSQAEDVLGRRIVLEQSKVDVSSNTSGHPVHEMHERIKAEFTPYDNS